VSRKSSFPPVVAAGTRVLILGSLPGERSLAERRYYAHPQNQFWRLVGSVIGSELEALGYEARLEALLSARIGLWDTVASATRTGSLDAAIREAERRREGTALQRELARLAERLSAIEGMVAPAARAASPRKARFQPGGGPPAGVG
jgi:hypoxanthine-DNA glycosylase